MENVFLGGAEDFKGPPPVLPPFPRAGPSKSPKRLGSALGRPIPAVVAVDGADDDQLLPKMSPAMEVLLDRLDLAAAVAEGAGWWVQEGLLVAREEAAGVAGREPAVEDEKPPTAV